ncbi:helix-turn-helix transcriptional regulator [Geobacter anodireducens]
MDNAREKKDFAVKLGARIKKQRERLGMNQRELAAATELKAASVAMYESGARVPSLEVFVDLVKTFGTTADHLLGATDQQDLFVDDEVEKAFRHFASLSPRDRKVIMEVIWALEKIPG